MSYENEKIYLSDSLVGVLKNDYDYKEERAEHMKKYESDDWDKHRLYMCLFNALLHLLSSLYFIILKKYSVLFHAKMQKENTILNLFNFQYDVILFQKNNMYLIFGYFQNRH